MVKTPRIELYVRSLAPGQSREYQEDILGRLESLDSEGRISGFEVVLCGECVCPSLKTAETDIGSRLVGRYEAFQQWAQTQDRELPGFEEKHTESLLTDTTITGVVFPRLTLAEYQEAELTFVAPSTNGTRQTSVLDRLEEY